jgi:hypothetical protein
MLCRYQVLMKQVPLVKSLVEHGDVDVLTALYCNVSLLYQCSHILLNIVFSFIKDPTTLEVMTRGISKALL